jgi:hypothetical protein
MEFSLIEALSSLIVLLNLRRKNEAAQKNENIIKKNLKFRRNYMFFKNNLSLQKKLMDTGFSSALYLEMRIQIKI